MPIVPKVDIDRARHADYEHNDIHPKTHGNDERADGAGIRDGGGGRPTEIEERKIKLVELRHSLQRRTEVCRQERGYYAKSHETHSHQKTALYRLGRLDSDTNPEHREDDRHHHRRSKTDNIRKSFFH